MMPGEINAVRTAPYLFYEDLAAAIDWLVAAFGCSEHMRLRGPGGFIAHAEVALGDGLVMLGNVGPRNAVRPVTVRSSVYAFVDDVDAHCRRAAAAGAEILEPPADQPYGDRVYLARDPEGHEWYFAQHLHDVTVDELERRFGGAPSP